MKRLAERESERLRLRDRETKRQADGQRRNSRETQT